MSRTSSPHSAELLTKREAAAYLGIAPRTLDDWRTAGAIPFIQRPGYVRFMQSDLDAFLQQHRWEARKVKPFRPRAGKRDSISEAQ